MISTYERAKKLRREMTKSEKILWVYLRRFREIGYPFRRQHPVGRFITDFYCPKLKLAIEIDGPIHNLEENVEYDKLRGQYFNALAIKTVRFTNQQILESAETVCAYIKNMIEYKA